MIFLGYELKLDQSERNFYAFCLNLISFKNMSVRNAVALGILLGVTMFIIYLSVFDHSEVIFVNIFP